VANLCAKDKAQLVGQ